MPRADDPDRAPFLEDDAQGLGEVSDRAGRRLLDEDVALPPLLIGEEHKVDRIDQRHQKARHGRIGDRELAAFLELLHEERVTEPRVAMTFP